MQCFLWGYRGIWNWSLLGVNRGNVVVQNYCHLVSTLYYSAFTWSVTMAVTHAIYCHEIQMYVNFSPLATNYYLAEIGESCEANCNRKGQFCQQNGFYAGNVLEKFRSAGATCTNGKFSPEIPHSVLPAYLASSEYCAGSAYYMPPNYNVLNCTAVPTGPYGRSLRRLCPCFWLAAYK